MGVSENIRDQFEAWARASTSHNLVSVRDGRYLDPETAAAWRAWQAALSHMQGQATPVDGNAPVLAGEAVGALRDALADMLSGWRYIRLHYGDLGGVGWDRAEQKAAEALATPPRPSAEPQQEAQGAVATLPVDVRGEWYDVPIPVQVYVTSLRMQLDGNFAGVPAFRYIHDSVQHCVSAAGEGEDYAVSRDMLDALTTLGLMKKVGRGKWAPTEAGEKLAALGEATPPAPVDVRQLPKREAGSA